MLQVAEAPAPSTTVSVQVTTAQVNEETRLKPKVVETELTEESSLKQNADDCDPRDDAAHGESSESSPQGAQE